MRVTIFSDIQCPFCYIGKRHFEAALARFSGRDAVSITWKSFQLDPSIPMKPEKKQNVFEYLAERKGLSLEHATQMHEQVTDMASRAGLTYHFDQAVIANSFPAHRIIQFAKTKDLGDAAEERFFSAYFTEGEDLGDEATLVRLGQEIGLSEAEVITALHDDRYAQLVKDDIAEAGTFGISGVPFFIFDGKYAVSGAQTVEQFAEVMEKVAATA